MMQFAVIWMNTDIMSCYMKKHTTKETNTV